MRYLVTGGAGFIGANFVRSLLDGKDCAVAVLDLLTYAGSLENLESVRGSGRFTFRKGDIRDAGAVGELAKGADVIVNFAAESHVDYSISRPDAFFSTNVLGTLVLLEAARKNDIEFVQISTDEVYGDVVSGESAEGDRLVPSSPYSASKAGADLLVGSYARTYGLSAKITRTTNNYGPYQHVEKLIPKLVAMALLGKRLPIYGNGKSVREWIHVSDNCSGIETVIRKGKKGGYHHERV